MEEKDIRDQNSVNNQSGAPQQPQQPQQPQPGYYQQPQPGYYQQPQPGYYQQPQQPQPGYYQQPQQPQPGYYQQPQQTVVVAASGKTITVSDRDREAVFKVGGGLFMLIMCIIASVSLLTSLISLFAKFSIITLPGVILEILTVIGLWIIWVNCKKKNVKPAGIGLVKFPFVFNFVLQMIVYILVLIVCVIILIAAMAAGTNFAGNATEFFKVIGLPLIILVLAVVSFVFNILYFNSVKGVLNLGKDILSGGMMRGPKAGMFAAIVTIIKGVINFLPGFLIAVASTLIFDALNEALGSTFGQVIDFLSDALSGAAALTIIVSLVGLFNDILAGILIIKFNKELAK